MTDLKLTDEAVALLPLQAGRAELLEEIMSIDTERHTTGVVPMPPSRRTRWLAPVAAAAVVAGIAGGAMAWQQHRDQPTEPPSFADSLGLPGDSGVILDAPGWTVDSLSSDGLMFRNGRANLEVTTYAAKDYDSYVTDREHIVDPPAAGAPIQVLGRSAQMWAYSNDDHTAIREVEGGRWMEFRGQGLDQAAYLALLGQLRQVPEDRFEASLPHTFVTQAERPAAADKILSAIEAVSGSGFPGDEPSFAQGDDKDRYQFGVEVVGAYTCAWLESYENAASHDQQDQVDAALAVLGTSRQWPILKEMDKDGDYPDVLWQIADEARAGHLEDWYREGLGCR